MVTVQPEITAQTKAKELFDKAKSEGLILRAFMLIVMDELNILRDLHSLAPRTKVQLRNAIRNKIDSGAAD